MKKTLLFCAIFINSIFVFSQNYVEYTSAIPQNDVDVTHMGRLSIGSTVYDADLNIYNNGNATVYLRNDQGRLQIGMSNCNGCFHSKSKKGTAVFRVLGASNSLILSMPNTNNDGNSSIRIADDFNKNSLLVFNNGKITMGTENYDSENYKLYVKEGIKTEKIKVEFANVNGWADYVFEPEYKLLELEDLKDFIVREKHLPDVPTKDEVVKEGLELKEFSATLLKKVEELTLHIIKLNEEIEKNEKRINELEENLNQ